MVLTARAVIVLAAYLAWREGYQRAVAHSRHSAYPWPFMIGADAVSQTFGEFLLQENSVAVDSVQRVAYLTHLVVVYHRYVGVIDWRTDISCIVVCFVDK